MKDYFASVGLGALLSAISVVAMYLAEVYYHIQIPVIVASSITFIVTTIGGLLGKLFK